jgi:hypothetical protein
MDDDIRLGDRVELINEVKIFTDHDLEEANYNFPVVSLQPGELFTVLGIQTNGVTGYLIDITETLEGVFEIWVLKEDVIKFTIPT